MVKSNVPRRIDDVDVVVHFHALPEAGGCSEVMVMPRSCSCSIQSMVAALSWTSPILWFDTGVEEDALGHRGLPGRCAR